MFRSTDVLMVRAPAHEVSVPQWPDLDGRTAADVVRWREWIEQMWKQPAVAEAVEAASPALAARIRAICDGHVDRPRQVRRVLVSIVRYVLRAQHRATPFGLFAGVAPARFGDRLAVRWGHGHHVAVRPDAAWLADVIAQLEGCPELLLRLPVVVDSTAVIRGARLVVPCQQALPGGSDAPTEISISLTRPLQTVLRLAREPVRLCELVDKLAQEHPGTAPATIRTMLSELVARRILLTGLHAPMTVPDPLGHVLGVLSEADADTITEIAPVVRRLHEIHLHLTGQPGADPAARTRLQASARVQMVELSEPVEQPLSMDTRLDCEVVLPTQVAREAEAAVSLLARLSPFASGSPAWQEYHTAFLERFGTGALVPLLDLVDPAAGLGLPAGYRGSLRTMAPPSLTARDELLLILAQHAALNDQPEITLDKALLARLTDTAHGQTPPNPPPAHTDLRFHLQATTPTALDRGAFRLTVTGLSSSAGTTVGRFLDTMPEPHRDRVTATFASLPTLTPAALRAQISSPPLRVRTENVARAPQALTHAISLAEHPTSGSKLIPLRDLAVGSEQQGLYLFSLARKQVIEPAVLTAVEPVNFTHPLARFLYELPRARAAVLAPFSWGAARTLPFLPRVRTARTILAPATWRLAASDLGPAFADERRWPEEFAAWQGRRRVPATVDLGEGDQRLHLDLDTPAHLQLLRDHLARTGQAVLREAPDHEQNGWIGERAHEFTLMLTTTQPAPHRPAGHRAAVPHARSHGHLPGASLWAYAKLYCPPDRQPEVLTRHLASLWEAWEPPPEWWYVRYNDPDPHLRLRIRLAHSADFGAAAERVSRWAADLRHAGLVSHLQWDTYLPETGRYGEGPTMAAAEDVFAADSTAAIAQLTSAARTTPLMQAITAASLVDLAISFTTDTAHGMQWLTEHIRHGVGPAPTPALREQAVRLADPDSNALHRLPGGQDIARAWTHRRGALTAYRESLPDAAAPEALSSLLHMHHIRAQGIDGDAERLSHRLARTAAISWLARHQATQP